MLSRIPGPGPLVTLIVTVTVTALCAGCGFLYTPAEPGIPASRLRSAGKSEIAGTSVEGRPIWAHTYGSGPRTLLLLGVVHGNESVGEVILQRLREYFRKRPWLLDGKRVVIVPVLNPDGLALKSRQNARGVDLNRNFPASNWRAHRRHGKRPGSEPETRAVLRLIERYRPERILAVHAPLYCVNYDGPAELLARRMARSIAYPLKPSIGYPTPGSLGSYAGRDLSLPVVTLESRRNLHDREAWDELQPALVEFVLHPSAARTRRIAGEPSRDGGGRKAAGK